MTNNIQKYTTYKPSGVEWLGDIPEHWEVRKGKWLFIKNSRPVRKNDDIVTCFRDGEVTLRINRKIDGFTNALKEHGYQGIRKGDLVIHNMDAFAGAIGVSDSDGKSTPVYSACTERVQNSLNPYYYAYFFGI
jgi:type I restriction enzyme S subunit